jgi:hypothetical protein
MPGRVRAISGKLSLDHHFLHQLLVDEPPFEIRAYIEELEREVGKLPSDFIEFLNEVKCTVIIGDEENDLSAFTRIFSLSGGHTDYPMTLLYAMSTNPSFDLASVNAGRSVDGAYGIILGEGEFGAKIYMLREGERYRLLYRQVDQVDAGQELASTFTELMQKISFE